MASFNITDITMSTKKKISEATSHLRVAVRVRPMNATERSEKCTNIVKAEMSKMTVNLKGKSFGPFFRVYDSETTQADIYDDLVSSQIKKVIAGFNCTVFAYGQTGTGKTFTMEGGRTDVKSSQDDPSTGIIPRAVEDIFEQLESSGCEEYSLRVSYVELYNEELFDLLASADCEDRERLRIFDDPNKKGVIVSGVEEVPVRNRADVFKLLEIGAEKRRTAATLMNMHSSRSHSLFMVNVVVRENTNTGEELVKQGKLNLVDLAGSENIGRSGAQGSRAKEAGSINQSLLTLGRVIRSLTTNAQHIPYRESKLTRLLQDSLGGSTITSLIATMSPSSSNFEESQSTLEYAMRAANIKNKPVCNTKVSKKTILKEYSDEIEKLRRDLRAAREKNGVIISEESHEEFQRNTEKVHELEQQLDCCVDRLRRFTEDLMHMDEQYKQLYERKGELEDRLRERMRQMAEKEKELADTEDELRTYMNALDTMHSTSLKSFDQLIKTHGAAGEMVTDLRSYWRKVDEMKAADDANTAVVKVFVEQMNSFVAKMSTHVKSMSSSSTTTMEEMRKAMEPPSEDLNVLSEEICTDSNRVSSLTSDLFNSASELEKTAADNLNTLNASIRKRWETSLDLCSKYHLGLVEKTDELQKELMDRLNEIKQNALEISNELQPLFSNIRGAVCESAEKRNEQSNAVVEDVKATCSAMAENMKAMLVQMEKMTVRVDDYHKSQVVSEQETQADVLSNLNTAENVIQSYEDAIVEQCDVEELCANSKEAIQLIDASFRENVESGSKLASQDESQLNNVFSEFIEQAETNRTNSNSNISPMIENIATNGGKCAIISKMVTEKTAEIAQKSKTAIACIEENSNAEISSASDAVKNVCLHHVDPEASVPERVEPIFPDYNELISPPDIDTLLSSVDGTEEVTDSHDDFLAKKKRRVTSFVRRDSLLDKTNVFMSPSSILMKRREQTIEEEEFEN